MRRSNIRFRRNPVRCSGLKGVALRLEIFKVNNNVKSSKIKIVQQRRRGKCKAEKLRCCSSKLAASAFGRAKSLGGKGAGTTGAGMGDGSRGNSETGRGTGSGNGSFDLDGRSLGPGGLPRPSYNVREEGKVVVTIVVNPSGQVIRTSINKMTNTTNPALRKAAEDAAKKARFNNVSGLNNQTGTITYYSQLKYVYYGNILCF